MLQENGVEHKRQTQQRKRKKLSNYPARKSNKHESNLNSWLLLSITSTAIVVGICIAYYYFSQNRHGQITSYQALRGQGRDTSTAQKPVHSNHINAKTHYYRPKLMIEHDSNY